MSGERTPPGVLVGKPGRCFASVTAASRRNELFLFSPSGGVNGPQEKLATARTRSPGRRGDRSPRLAARTCWKLAPHSCFALSVNNVARF